MSRREGLLIVAAALAACADEIDHDMIEAAAMTGPEGTVERALVPERDNWRYHDGGTDLGTAWRTGSTTSWASGAAPLGYGESYVVTTVSYGGDPANKHPTTYFRHGFDVPDPSKVRKLYLRAMFDDGFVFYLNGKEGGRAWMPGGTITFDTLSTGHETGNNYMTFDVSAQIPRLVAGANSLAVEVHQASRSSSDLTMDFALIAFVEDDGPPPYEPTPDGIPQASVWKHWNETTAPAAAWRDVDFDDSAWPHGEAPLGYGEPYLATTLPNRPITTYFRHAFTSDGGASALRLRAAFDDGYVAYLNGVEIARRHMPEGPVTPTTLAFFREEDGGTPDDLVVLDDKAYLVRDGLNVLAVEVHQNASTSSDLVWDARLEQNDDNAWYGVPSGTINDLHDVAFIDASHGWAVGDLGTLLETHDGGETWARVESGTTQNLRAITFVPQPQGTSIGFIAGDNGTVLESPGGHTWDLRPISGVTADFGGVSAVPGEPAEPIAMTVLGISAEPPAGLGYYGRTIQTSPWEHVPAGVESTAILATSTDDVFLASFASTETGGAIHHYDPTTGVLTEKWSFGQHGAYPQVLRTQGSTLWMCGFISLHFQGDLKVRSRDGGETWELMPQASGRPLYDCAFGDAPSQLGVAVGLFGGISMSEDGGESWRTVQGPGFFESFNLYGADVLDGSAWIVGEHGTILKLAGSPTEPVPQFTRDPANPVLDRTTDDPDGFDPSGPHNPMAVAMADGGWTMLHDASNGHEFSDVIGRAVSPDGVTWTSMGAMMWGTDPFVVSAGGVFHLFSNYFDGEHHYRHLTSPDLVTWTTVQDDLGWDLGDASIVHDGSRYVLLHATFDGVQHATSPDLSTWTFTPGIVFDPSPSQIKISVLFEGGVYKMWFTREGSGNLYYATSSDGVTWTEHGTAMQGSGAAGWDAIISGPSVVRVADTLHLWYAGHNETHWRIGHATMTSP